MPILERAARLQARVDVVLKDTDELSKRMDETFEWLDRLERELADANQVARRAFQRLPAAKTAGITLGQNIPGAEKPKS